jgi:EmrB/QacA subfamily drug resistance transporter
MAVIIIADVMDLLDSVIANIAGPAIRASLGGGETTLQWILAGYTLAFAVGLITSARAGDIVGRRQMFIIGMAGFTVASLACGLAPTAGTLIAFRIVQGLFGAVMLPQGFAMVSQCFSADDLQKAFIPFGPIMGLAAVVGPILGGFLVDADILGTGWRAIFLVNVPIGIVGVILSWRYLPRFPVVPGAKLDLAGSALVTIGCAALIYPLVQGRELGWPWWIYVLIAAALVVFLLFAISERHSDHPVIEPSLFGNRGFLAGLVFLGTFFVAMTGLNLIINLFFQLGLGYSPTHTGLAMIPNALGMAISAGLGGAVLGPKLGRHCLHIGLAVAGVGLVWFALVAHSVTATGAWDFAPSLFVSGLGAGLIFAPLFGIILASLGENETGSASGLLNAMQQFSGALGVAVLGTLFFGWLPSQGWHVSTEWILWVTLGCYAVAFLTVFLLPLQAREEAAH